MSNMGHFYNSGGARCYEPCGCGSTDCAECFPELQEIVECECCGREVRRWALCEGDLCEDCSSAVMRSCHWCGEWHPDSEMIEGYCLKCYSTEIKDKEKAV